MIEAQFGKSGILQYCLCGAIITFVDEFVSTFTFNNVTDTELCMLKR